MVTSVFADDRWGKVGVWFKHPGEGAGGVRGERGPARLQHRTANIEPDPVSHSSLPADTHSLILLVQKACWLVQPKQDGGGTKQPVVSQGPAIGKARRPATS